MPETLDEAQLAKLTIEAYKKQTFEEADRDATYTVLFNPTDYTRARSNNYNRAQAAGTSRPSTSSGSGNPDQLTIAFFFDGTGVVGDPGPVTERVSDFLDLMKYRGDQHKPRYLWVRWGPLDFRGVMKTASANFTLFDREGRPLRAKVNAAFEEVVEDRERVNTESASSPDLHRVWRVREHEGLDAIAYEAYGDPAFWRALAEVNRLENPRALVPGQLLQLPPKER
jgi:hypothetical protein